MNQSQAARSKRGEQKKVQREEEVGKKKKHAFRVEEPKMWRMNKLSLSAAEHTAQKCNYISCWVSKS